LNIDFSDLGMDSITQMDLITALEKERRFRDLPQTLFADNATILALTDFFYHHHREADYDLKPS
jgi:acyl carrier protein